jgi:hypothetical protein
VYAAYQAEQALDQPTGTEHRLRVLRQWLNACLPGKSLGVYEPGLGLVTDNHAIAAL